MFEFGAPAPSRPGALPGLSAAEPRVRRHLPPAVRLGGDPGRAISGLEDEFRLSEDIPRLLYLKKPADAVEPRLQAMLDEVSEQGSASYRHFADVAELATLVEDDLAALLSERFLARSYLAVPGSNRSEPSPLAAAAVPLTPTVGRERRLPPSPSCSAATHGW